MTQCGSPFRHAFPLLWNLPGTRQSSLAESNSSFGLRRGSGSHGSLYLCVLNIHSLHSTHTHITYHIYRTDYSPDKLTWKGNISNIKYQISISNI